MGGVRSARSCFALKLLLVVISLLLCTHDLYLCAPIYLLNVAEGMFPVKVGSVDQLFQGGPASLSSGVEVVI
jgi:hypothetical protein